MNGFNIAEGTILEFDTGGTNIINPFKKPDSVTVASAANTLGTLTAALSVLGGDGADQLLGKTSTEVLN